MDLTTNYLGLSLRSPLVPSASPLSEKIDNIRAMEQAGAAAVVFHSLFEEQIEAAVPEFRIDPNTYLEEHHASQTRSRHSNHRQFELHYTRWVDQIRAANH